MNQTLHLVRHGQASAGSADYDRLSPRGREQSEILGDWWRRTGFACDAAWHGTLKRQRDTTSLALGSAGLEIPIGVLPALDEYDHRAVDLHLGERVVARDEHSGAPVDPEDISYADYALLMRRWRDRHEVPTPLENWASFASRGWNAIRDTALSRPDAETLVFFTSGGIVSTVMASVLGLDFEHTIDAIWRVRNASVTSFAFDGEAARLIEFNNVAHLASRHEPDLVTLI